MIDRDYDIAFLEIIIRNDELEREWRLHKLGRRAEVLLNANQSRIIEEVEGAGGLTAPPGAQTQGAQTQGAR